MFLRPFIAGYVACIMTIAAIGLFASVFAQSYLVAMVGSYHFDREKKYNENNLSLGIEQRLSDDWSVSAGFFRNSFDRHTNYIFAGYTPVEVYGWRTGVVMGGVTGYEERMSPWFTGIATRDFGSVGINVVFASAAIAIQLKIRIDK